MRAYGIYEDSFVLRSLNDKKCEIKLVYETYIDDKNNNRVKVNPDTYTSSYECNDNSLKIFSDVIKNGEQVEGYIVVLRIGWTDRSVLKNESIPERIKKKYVSPRPAKIRVFAGDGTTVISKGGPRFNFKVGLIKTASKLIKEYKDMSPAVIVMP